MTDEEVNKLVAECRARADKIQAREWCSPSVNAEHIRRLCSVVDELMENRAYNSNRPSGDVIHITCLCGSSYVYNHGDTESGVIGAIAWLSLHRGCIQPLLCLDTNRTHRYVEYAPFPPVRIKG